MVLAVWLTLAALWVLFLVPVLVLRRRVDRYAWPAWRIALRGEVADHFAYLRELLEGNSEAVRMLLNVAEQHDARGARAQARQRLLLLFEIVGAFVGRARERLDEWLVVCRAALALYPLPPISTQALDLRTLRTLAMVHNVLHAIAVTSGERFRLRLRLLDQCFRMVAWIARRAGRRLEQRPSPDTTPGDWRRARGVAHDFDALTYETLATARGLLAVAETARGVGK